MREIIFKAKRIDNGEWVQGNLFVEGNRAEITRGTCNGVGIEGVSVDKDTICQYTGLTDKNGNKIWENDIVKCYSIDVANRENEFISNVYWDDCMWCVHEKECCDNLLCYFDMSKNWCSHIPEIEVIGNTFDNPDLLKGE